MLPVTPSIRSVVGFADGSCKQDMIGRDTFSLTQEFLFHMLGVRRNTVSVEAHAVQEAGLIRYKRGTITILNRDGLEDCSCECYSVIREETDKLMGPAKT